MTKPARWLLVTMLGVNLYILLGLIDIRATPDVVMYAWVLSVGLWIAFGFYLLRER